MGVRWLLSLRHLHWNGVVADEMGLGKTVQVIHFFTALASRGHLGTHLIIAPLSTLENWHQEVRRWAPWLHCIIYRGTAPERAKCRSRMRRRHRRAFTQADALRRRWQVGEPVSSLSQDLGGVVLTSYEMVWADTDAIAKCLHWDTVVVDEAQRLKKLDRRLLRSL